MLGVNFEKIGEKIANLLYLKSENRRYETDYGLKTADGLAKSVLAVTLGDEYTIISKSELKELLTYKLESLKQAKELDSSWNYPIEETENLIKLF